SNAANGAVGKASTTRANGSRAILVNGRPWGGAGWGRAAPRAAAKHPQDRSALRFLVQLSRTCCRTDESGVAFELRVTDLRLLSGHRESQPFDMPPDAVEETLAGGDHASAEYDHVRIDGVHRIVRAHCEIERGFLNQAFGQGIASRRDGENVFGRDLALFPQGRSQSGWPTVAGKCLLRAFDYGCGAGVGFEAAPAAAATLTRIGHLN